MALGLPPHLAPRAISLSFLSAIHTTAFTCLVGALLVSLSFQARWPSLILWPASLATVPMLVLLYLLDRARTRLLSVAYLCVGAASVYGYSLAFTGQMDIGAFADSVTVALPKIALMLVGGSGIGPGPALRWATAGFLMGELASYAAIAQASQRYSIDEISVTAYLITAAVLTASWFGQRGARRVQPLLYRAAQEELVAALRHRMELRAAALLHDTVLNHLSALAGSRPGPLSALMRAQIERDLALLVGEEWLADGPRTRERRATDWHSTPLFSAVSEARSLGLGVDTTGDTTALLKLDGERSRELGLAVAQCLANVTAHSGAEDAEVVVYGSGGEVMVMVVDAGSGFDEDEIGADRLGLKNSVRRRIEDVGGSVRVWSTPGRGTSVVIRVPTRPADRAHAAARVREER